MAKFQRHRLSRHCVAALLLASAFGAGAAGIYETVELRKREPNDLMDTAAQFHEQFGRRSLLYAEQSVVDLVQGIGSDLAPPATDDYIEYRFGVIRDPSPNAFAMPNGDIYVHTGMLARLEDSSQLAALLAHEINHVAGHHGILHYRITAKKLLIDMFGGGLASLMTQLRFSRELEQEADNRAPQLLAGTAYDPHGMPELLEALAEDFEGLRPRIASIWTTHPDPDARVEESRFMVADLPSKERDVEAFDAIVFPLRAITLRDYIQDDYPYTAIALAERFLERYPKEPEFRILLGDAWQRLGPRSEFAPDDFTNRDKRRNLRRRVFKTRQEREQALLETEAGQQAYSANLSYARETYQLVVDMDSSHAPAYRGLGEVAEKLNQPREAARQYLEYLQRAPDAADRSIIIGRLTAIRDLLSDEENGNAGE